MGCLLENLGSGLLLSLALSLQCELPDKRDSCLHNMLLGKGSTQAVRQGKNMVLPPKIYIATTI